MIAPLYENVRRDIVIADWIKHRAEVMVEDLPDDHRTIKLDVVDSLYDDADLPEHSNLPPFRGSI